MIKLLNPRSNISSNESHIRPKRHFNQSIRTWTIKLKNMWYDYWITLNKLSCFEINDYEIIKCLYDHTFLFVYIGLFFDRLFNFIAIEKGKFTIKPRSFSNSQTQMFAFSKNSKPAMVFSNSELSIPVKTHILTDCSNRPVMTRTTLKQTIAFPFIFPIFRKFNVMRKYIYSFYHV